MYFFYALPVHMIKDFRPKQVIAKAQHYRERKQFIARVLETQNSHTALVYHPPTSPLYSKCIFWEKERVWFCKYVDGEETTQRKAKAQKKTLKISFSQPQGLNTSFSSQKIIFE